MVERMYRTRIEDLASVGEELTEEHLRLASGAADKKLAGGGGRQNEGTSWTATTYVQVSSNGAMACETDGPYED
jgi:hypothetical protein